MKKISLTLIILLTFFTSQVNAQNKQVNVGLFFNPAFSWLSTSIKGVTPNGSRFSSDIGLEISYNFNEMYTFTSGLTVSQRGGKLDFATLAMKSLSDTLKDAQIQYLLQYVEVPINMRLNFKGISDSFTPFTQFGLNSAVNVGSRANIISPSLTEDIVKQRIGKDIVAFNAGLLLMGGVEVPVSENTSLYAALSYTHSFITISSRQSDLIQQRNFGLRVGFRL